MPLARAILLIALVFCEAKAIASEANTEEPTAKALEIFGEKDLVKYKKSNNSEFLAFRFIWSRSFNDPMMFRVIIKNGNMEPEITIKKYSNQKQMLTLEKTRPLTKNQVTNLVSFARAADFWNRPEKIDGNILDGAEWKLEGASNNAYHRTTRWSPLPPYYPGAIDPATRKIVKKPNLRFEDQAKISDEVGLDMFGMLIMLMHEDFDEEIY